MLRRAGSIGGANPENQFENVLAKFLSLKGMGRKISLSLHQKCYISGHKIVIFNHLMLVDANCDDSVTISRCLNLVMDLKVSVALKKIFSCAYAFW